VKKKEEEKK